MFQFSLILSPWYLQSSDPTDKDVWKDRGMGNLSIKCKEGVAKATKESKPTIVVRNEVCLYVLSSYILVALQGIDLNVIPRLSSFCIEIFTYFFSFCLHLPMAGRENSSQCLVVSWNQDKSTEELSRCNISYCGKKVKTCTFC